MRRSQNLLFNYTNFIWSEKNFILFYFKCSMSEVWYFVNYGEFTDYQQFFWQFLKPQNQSRQMFVQKRNNNCLLDGTDKGNSLLSHKVNCGKSFKVGLEESLSGRRKRHT